MFIKGETKTVETIPTGAKEPKTFTLIGQVAICAPVDAANDEEIFGGNTGARIRFKSSAKIRIPAKAP